MMSEKWQKLKGEGEVWLLSSGRTDNGRRGSKAIIPRSIASGGHSTDRKRIAKKMGCVLLPTQLVILPWPSPRYSASQA